jgi:hypothetical protein
MRVMTKNDYSMIVFHDVKEDAYIKTSLTNSELLSDEWQKVVLYA